MAIINKILIFIISTNSNAKCLCYSTWYNMDSLWNENKRSVVFRASVRVSACVHRHEYLSLQHCLCLAPSGLYTLSDHELFTSSSNGLSWNIMCTFPTAFTVSNNLENKTVSFNNFISHLVHVFFSLHPTLLEIVFLQYIIEV